jgi:hypothetical protein
MPEAEQLSDLIGAIYDASLNPELWLPVLEQTSRFINSATATIGSRDMLQKHTSFSKAWGYDPHYLQLLESHYLKINPLNEGAALTRVGDVLSIGEVIPYTQFYASAMYLEWGKPQGYIDAIQATLEKTGTALAFFHGPHLSSALSRRRTGSHGTGLGRSPTLTEHGRTIPLPG